MEGLLFGPARGFIGSRTFDTDFFRFLVVDRRRGPAGSLRARSGRPPLAGSSAERGSPTQRRRCVSDPDRGYHSQRRPEKLV